MRAQVCPDVAECCDAGNHHACNREAGHFSSGDSWAAPEQQSNYAVPLPGGKHSHSADFPEGSLNGTPCLFISGLPTGQSVVTQSLMPLTYDDLDF